MCKKVKRIIKTAKEGGDIGTVIDNSSGREVGVYGAGSRVFRSQLVQ